jgi:hypothetical protein
MIDEKIKSSSHRWAWGMVAGGAVAITTAIGAMTTIAGGLLAFGITSMVIGGICVIVIKARDDD